MTYLQISNGDESLLKPTGDVYWTLPGKDNVWQSKRTRKECYYEANKTRESFQKRASKQ